MERLRRFLLEDWGTKSLALILALAIYVHVFSAQEREMTFRVPLVIQPLPSDLAIAGDVPDEARVRIRATGEELLRLRTRPLHAEVRLESPSEGTLQRPLLGTDLQLPRGVRPALVEVLEPRVLNLTIEPSVAERFPVAVKTRGDLPASRALLEAPQPIPRRVRVSGPRSVIAEVDSIETVPVSLDVPPGDVERDVRLVVPAGLDAETQEIRVAIRTEDRLTRRICCQPIRLVPNPGGHLLWTHPDSATVMISGPESIVARIDDADVQVTSEVARGYRSQTAALRASVRGLRAPDIVSIWTEPESVIVRLQ